MLNATIGVPVLVIEDEPAVCEQVMRILRQNGFRPAAVLTRKEILEHVEAGTCAALVLDLGLPGDDGVSIAKAVREVSDIPILMLTAKGQTADKVAGLKIGADDYVTKPFDMQELMARVEALLRRAPARATVLSEVVHIGPNRVDLRGTEVMRDGHALPLSAREFQLLRYFLEHPGATLTREQLLTDVWGYSGKMFTRTVDVHVASLRQKLEPEPRQPRHLVTVQGLGYKFRPQDS